MVPELMKESVLICYLSYGGNTKEVAELIHKTVVESGYQAQLHRVGFGSMPDFSLYGLIIMGSFTWVNGSVPEEMKDFIGDIGYKPSPVAVFGTGDTQFGGEDIYCNAATKMAKFYDSSFETLKIEQSPRESQEDLVREWTKGVMDTWKTS